MATSHPLSAAALFDLKNWVAVGSFQATPSFSLLSSPFPLPIFSPCVSISYIVANDPLFPTVTGGGTGLGLSMYHPSHCPAPFFSTTLSQYLPAKGSQQASATFKLSNGLLAVIAQTLAINGARVYITGRRADVLETSARVHGARDKLGGNGGEILPIVMDVTDKESIKAAVDKIQANEGYLNVWVR